MNRTEEKHKAIELRKKGLTFSEIQSCLINLPKSTLSGWLKDIELTEIQKKRIREKMIIAGNKGRLKGAWANREKKKIRISKIQKEAEMFFKKNLKNQLFLIGIALYWSEGNQKTKRFQFTNSNPQMIKIMMRWLDEVCGINQEEISFRLYIHKIYNNEKCEEYWSELLKYPKSRFQRTIFKPTNHSVKKNPSYKGCLKIDIKGSELYWKVQRWQELIANKPSW